MPAGPLGGPVAPGGAAGRGAAAAAGRDPGADRPAADLLRGLLARSNRYALTTLYPTVWAHGVTRTDDVTRHAGGARSSGAEALALAVATELGAYDPLVTGRSIRYARGVALWLIRSSVCRHAAVSEAGWGAGNRPVTPDLHEWQSPLHAMQIAAAAWLLWPMLDEVDRYRVAAMVVNEADRLVPITPQVQGLPSGAVRRPGDTKAEEDAVIATLPGLAAAMMPRHPHRAAWRRQEIRFALTAWATPGDLRRTDLVHGLPLRSWLPGWNLRADGTVVNHSIVHPAYAAVIALSASAPAFYGLAGGAAPVATRHNLSLVYGSLLRHRFAAPPYAAPGGTVYRPGTGEVYLPQGNDWGTRSVMAQLVLLDTVARGLRIAPEAARFQRWHGQYVAALQRRSYDGRTYQSPAEARYVAPEEFDAESLSRAWLVEWAAANGRLRFVDDDASARPAVSRWHTSGQAWATPSAGAGRVAPRNPVVLAGRSAGPPLVPPRLAAVRTGGGLTVTTAAPLGPRVAVTVVAAAHPRNGFLLHVSSRPAVASVIRLDTGRLQCRVSVTRDRAGVLVRAPQACFRIGGRVVPLAPPRIAATAEGGPADAPALTVTRSP